MTAKDLDVMINKLMKIRDTLRVLENTDYEIDTTTIMPKIEADVEAVKSTMSTQPTE